MPPLIRFDNVSVSIRQNTIFTSVSFEVYSGQKILICGKSGAGKSCLLKTLLGMYPLKTGTVYFQEQALTRQSVQYVRSCAAYIGQEPVLGADTVREALLLPFQFQAHKERRPNEAQLTSVLRRLQLTTDILNADTQRISGGEKQRIALARGLLLGKTIYLLDEATSALDSSSKQAVFDIFTDPDITLLAVTHDTDWSQYSTSVITMTDGKLEKTKPHGNP